MPPEQSDVALRQAVRELEDAYGEISSDDVDRQMERAFQAFSAAAVQGRVPEGFLLDPNRLRQIVHFDLAVDRLVADVLEGLPAGVVLRAKPVIGRSYRVDFPRDAADTDRRGHRSLVRGWSHPYILGAGEGVVTDPLGRFRVASVEQRLQLVRDREWLLREKAASLAHNGRHGNGAHSERRQSPTPPRLGLDEAKPQPLPGFDRQLDEAAAALIAEAGPPPRGVVEAGVGAAVEGFAGAALVGLVPQDVTFNANRARRDAVFRHTYDRLAAELMDGLPENVPVTVHGVEYHVETVPDMATGTAHKTLIRGQRNIVAALPVVGFEQSTDAVAAAAAGGATPRVWMQLANPAKYFRWAESRTRFDLIEAREAFREAKQVAVTTYVTRLAAAVIALTDEIGPADTGAIEKRMALRQADYFRAQEARRYRGFPPARPFDVAGERLEVTFELLFERLTAELSEGLPAGAEIAVGETTYHVESFYDRTREGRRRILVRDADRALTFDPRDDLPGSRLRTVRTDVRFDLVEQRHALRAAKAALLAGPAEAPRVTGTAGTTAAPGMGLAS